MFKITEITMSFHVYMYYAGMLTDINSLSYIIQVSFMSISHAIAYSRVNAGQRTFTLIHVDIGYVGKSK